MMPGHDLVLSAISRIPVPEARAEFARRLRALLPKLEEANPEQVQAGIRAALSTIPEGAYVWDSEDGEWHPGDYERPPAPDLLVAAERYQRTLRDQAPYLRPWPPKKPLTPGSEEWKAKERENAARAAMTDEERADETELWLIYDGDREEFDLRKSEEKLEADGGKRPAGMSVNTYQTRRLERWHAASGMPRPKYGWGSNLPWHRPDRAWRDPGEPADGSWAPAPLAIAPPIEPPPIEPDEVLPPDPDVDPDDFSEAGFKKRMAERDDENRDEDSFRPSHDGSRQPPGTRSEEIKKVLSLLKSKRRGPPKVYFR